MIIKCRYRLLETSSWNKFKV